MRQVCKRTTNYTGREHLIQYHEKLFYFFRYNLGLWTHKENKGRGEEGIIIYVLLNNEVKWCNPNIDFFFLELYFMCCSLLFGVWSKASTVPSSHVKRQKPPAPYVCAHQWVYMPYAWKCWCNAFSVPIISLSAQQWECSLVQSLGEGVCATLQMYLYAHARPYTCTWHV